MKEKNQRTATGIYSDLFKKGKLFIVKSDDVYIVRPHYEISKEPLITSEKYKIKKDEIFKVIGVFHFGDTLTAPCFCINRNQINQSYTSNNYPSIMAGCLFFHYESSTEGKKYYQIIDEAWTLNQIFNNAQSGLDYNDLTYIEPITAGKIERLAAKHEKLTFKEKSKRFNMLTENETNYIRTFLDYFEVLARKQFSSGDKDEAKSLKDFSRHKKYFYELPSIPKGNCWIRLQIDCLNDVSGVFTQFVLELSKEHLLISKEDNSSDEFVKFIKYESKDEPEEVGGGAFDIFKVGGEFDFKVKHSKEKIDVYIES